MPRPPTSEERSFSAKTRRSRLRSCGFVRSHPGDGRPRSPTGRSSPHQPTRTQSADHPARTGASRDLRPGLAQIIRVHEGRPKPDDRTGEERTRRCRSRRLHRTRWNHQPAITGAAPGKATRTEATRVGRGHRQPGHPRPVRRDRLQGHGLRSPREPARVDRHAHRKKTACPRRAVHGVVDGPRESQSPSMASAVQAPSRVEESSRRPATDDNVARRRAAGLRDEGC
jgi:hypothetical protein